jgi:hypothetical protein
MASFEPHGSSLSNRCQNGKVLSIVPRFDLFNTMDVVIDNSACRTQFRVSRRPPHKYMNYENMLARLRDAHKKKSWVFVQANGEYDIHGVWLEGTNSDITK